MPGNCKQELSELLESARPFLRGELESIDTELPKLMATLRAAGAGECWHKDGSFIAHLADVYRILHLWKSPRSISLCGLYHSAYSNSYVNLAIFEPSQNSRSKLQSILGFEAERLVHFFCIVPRQQLIHDELLFHYTSDEELRTHLSDSEKSWTLAREYRAFDSSEAWRKKLKSVLPDEGVIVEHTKTGENLKVSRRMVAAFLLMTMADFSDQLFGFQDVLFQNENGRLEFNGNNNGALWPGDGKPGLWMNSISRMGAIYSLIVREEEIYILERTKNEADLAANENRDEGIELVLPPVFHNCSKVLDAEEQIQARDLYWEATISGGRPETGGIEKAEKLLVECCKKNPYVGEPHLVLGQIYLAMGKYEEAKKEAEEGLKILLHWGSSWDKRMSWEAWIAWGRVLLVKAAEQNWPKSGWGVINLGLVR